MIILSYHHLRALCYLRYGWLAVYVRGDPVGYAQAGELYVLGARALLEPSFPDVSQLDIHLGHPNIVVKNPLIISRKGGHTAASMRNRHSIKTTNA